MLTNPKICSRILERYAECSHFELYMDTVGTPAPELLAEPAEAVRAVPASASAEAALENGLKALEETADTYAPAKEEKPETIDPPKSDAETYTPDVTHDAKPAGKLNQLGNEAGIAACFGISTNVPLDARDTKASGQRTASARRGSESAPC